MSASTPVREVACPGCGVATVYAPTNPYRPFCSQRCKLMDLGDWASEKFRIPDNTPADDFESQSHE